MIPPPVGASTAQLLSEPRLFRRVDETDDAEFYRTARMVLHIDVSTVAALTQFYRSFIPAGARVLDLMSSWVSHLPDELPLSHVAGLGMNAEELAANPRLDDYLVQNLNTRPHLPYPAGSFDRILCCVSVQYLVQPVVVFRSAFECLEPGGALCIATSHRLFPTKAIAAFAQLPPQVRIQLIIAYLQEAGFADVEFIDRSPPQGDPLWLIVGRRPPRT